MTASPLLRFATPADGAAVAAIYAPVVRDTAISFELAPPSADEMATRIVELLAAYPWLIAARGDHVLGYAYAGVYKSRAAYRWACETTIYIAEEARGQGVGRALYEALFPILVRQGYVMAYAGITLPNAGSVGLHEATGFTRVGAFQKAGFKGGQWWDVGWWEKPLAAAPAQPGEPIPFAQLAMEGPAST